MLSNSLDTDSIHGDIHDRSCKKSFILPYLTSTLYLCNYIEYLY